MLKKLNTYKPEVGMGVTICHWSDRTPATIISITSSGAIISLQEDSATRTDSNGMSDSQEYMYQSDPNGAVYKATLRKDGTYRLKGGKQQIILGSRRKFHDFSF
jgi:hypothetical protein